MARRSYRPEQIIKKLREIEALLSRGFTVDEAARNSPVLTSLADHHRPTLRRRLLSPQLHCRGPRICEAHQLSVLLVLPASSFGVVITIPSNLLCTLCPLN